MLKAKPYRSLTVSPDDNVADTLNTVLDHARVAATIVDHGAMPSDFWDEHTSPVVTLRDLRDWLGY
jgi:hypothetical protein